MKKEKTVRTYQRRTKSGKMVTVREHKASYDAAEEARKAAAKKAGAGSELSKKKAAVEENPLGFSADDYKEWYHWDMENDPKNEAALRVEKALTKKMGKKAYNKYLEDMSNSYSARGHKKAHQALLDEYTAQQKKQDVESSKTAKDIARSAKEKAAEAKAAKTKDGKSVKTPSVPENLEKFGGSSLMVGDNASKAVQQLKDAGLKSFKSGVMTYYVHPDGKSVYAHDTEDGELRRRSTDRREFARHDKTIDKILSSYGTPTTSSSRSMTTDYSRDAKTSAKTKKEEDKSRRSATPETSESYAKLKRFEGSPYRMRISKNGDPMPGEKQKLAKWKAGHKKLKEYLSTPEGAADKKSYVAKQKEKERKAEERRKRDVAKWREKYTAEKRLKRKSLQLR